MSLKSTLKSRLRTGSVDSLGAGQGCTYQHFQDSDKWPVMQHVGVPMAVRIPLTGVRLRDVQALKPGATLESLWPAAEEVPLLAAGVALSWCEFEGVEQMMAVRITRLG